MHTIIHPLKKKSQSPVITDRLIHINGFLVDLHFDKKPIPHVCKFKGKTFYRYMDRLFSPLPISNLNSKQSVALCDIRLKYFEKLINESTNDIVVKEIAKLFHEHTIAPSNMLDFGCGNGKYTKIFKNHFPTYEMFGIDLSKLAIEYAKNHDEIFWLHINENESLPFKDEYFAFITSTFVMHLNISVKLLVELNRILHHDGKFIFNIYNKKYLKTDLFDKFNKAGFIIDILPTNDLLDNHLLLLAKKAPCNFD